MSTEKNEIRTCNLDVAIREVEGQEASRTIYGTAIVFNSESEVLDDFGFKFREVIKPEAAQQAFLDTQDIKLNLLHDRKDTIGRSRMGAGNLRYSVDEKGVNFEIDVPKCDIGDRALEMVRSGVYTGCSFEFIPDQYDVEDRGKNKEPLITHKRFKAVKAFTLGMDPAYSKTTVNAREVWKETEEAEAAKREAERQAARQREKDISAAQQWQREHEQEEVIY